MRTSFILILAFFLSIDLLSQNDFRQDSIYIDEGIEQTQDFEPKSRVYFEAYAENGRPSEIVSTRPNDAGGWIPHQRRLLSYTGDRLSTLRIQVWSAAKQNWVDFSERRIAYTPEGRLESLLLLAVPGADMPLENLQRKLYTYTQSGQQESIQTQRWINNAWQNVWRQSFTYDAMDEPLTRLLQVWSDSDWENKFQRTWTYDQASGENKEIITQRWSAQNNQWVNLQRRELFYNNSGFWVGSLYQRWDAGRQAWENNSRELHQLNNRNTLDNFIFQIWLGNEWVNSSREVTYQDDLSFGNIIQRWDEMSGRWENYIRYQTTLNEQALLSEMLDKQVWDRQGEAWLNDADTERRTYFWSDATVSSQEAFYPSLDCLIPNPYHPGAVISCPDLKPGAKYSLELFDMAGRRLSTQVLRSGSEITLPANLSRGAYLLQIRQDQRLRLVEKLLVVN